MYIDKEIQLLRKIVDNDYVVIELLKSINSTLLTGVSSHSIIEKIEALKLHLTIYELSDLE